MEEPSEEDFFTKNLKTTFKSQKNDDGTYNQSLTCYKGIFLCSIKTNTTTHLPSMSQPSFCRIHWSQQNNQTYFKGFMVTTNVKVCEKTHSHLQHVCTNKRPCHWPYGLLQLVLPIPKSQWSSISMNFIIDFPCFKSYKFILVCLIDWERYWPILFQPPRWLQVK